MLTIFKINKKHIFTILLVFLFSISSLPLELISTINNNNNLTAYADSNIDTSILNSSSTNLLAKSSGSSKSSSGSSKTSSSSNLVVKVLVDLNLEMLKALPQINLLLLITLLLKKILQIKVLKDLNLEVFLIPKMIIQILQT